MSRAIGRSADGADGTDRAVEPGASGMRRILFASFIGTTIEWYDFFLFGVSSAVVFNKIFFPKSEPLVGTLIAFAIFGAGYVARPVGGVLFGHMGDRVGRKATLVSTLVIMAVSTFLMGVLPTYAAVGVLAPILLVLLRLLQGLAVGGEWAGAVLIAVENSPGHRRGLYGSVAIMGAPAGFLLATAVSSVVFLLPQDQLLGWGWRIPFLLSVVLLVVGLFVRMRVLESPVFRSALHETRAPRFPVADVVRHPKNVVLGALLRCIEGVPSSIYAFAAATFVVQQLLLPASVGTAGVAIASVVALFVVPLAAAASDRFGRRRVYMVAAGYSAVVAFPVFWLMETRSTAAIWIALVFGFGVGVHAVYGPMAAYYAELFGTFTRYTGASLGYQLGGAVFTGFSPLAATALLAWSGGEPWPVAGLIMIAAVVSIVASRFAVPVHTGR